MIPRLWCEIKQQSSVKQSCMWFSPLFHFLLHRALQWGERIAFAWLRARKESDDTSAVGSERSLCSFEGLNIFQVCWMTTHNSDWNHRTSIPEKSALSFPLQSHVLLVWPLQLTKAWHFHLKCLSPSSILRNVSATDYKQKTPSQFTFRLPCTFPRDLSWCYKFGKLIKVQTLLF